MTSNEHPGIHRRRAGIWRVVAGVAFLLICAVTLTPSTGPPSRGFSICIRCGDSNGLDVFYNVVLFVPLGFALWRAGVNRRSAIAFAAALSIVDDQMDVITRKQAALSALFRTLLHELMTARIRVHDLDWSESYLPNTPRHCATLHRRWRERSSSVAR